METPRNTLQETQRWLKESGVLSAVKGFCFLEENDALGGLESIGDMLKSVKYSSVLGHKLVGHLSRINREDLIPYIYDDIKKGGIH